MSWTSILLSDPSPNLRYLVLQHLLNEHDEAKELEDTRLDDPIIKRLLASQNQDGSWGQESIMGNAPQGKIQTTSQALTRLGYLELTHPAIDRGVEYIYSQQLEDGSWPLDNYQEGLENREGYDTISLQTSLPLRGLAETGYANDPRSEKAYDWLLRQRLPDGAWPTGVTDGVYGYVAGYRRLPHSRWGCRSNTTSAVMCLSLHPTRRKSIETRRAMEHLLSRETYERYNLGYDVARTVGIEASTGFITYYAHFDAAQILTLVSRLEASISDRPVKNLVHYIMTQRGENGLWMYPKPQASRWITYDILRSLKGAINETDWLILEPRTPFQTYPAKKKRF